MTRYATTEKMWECWGCGFDIPLRSMWIKEQYPYTHRCPGCKENILFIDEPNNIRRAGAYYGPLLYADYDDPLFNACAGIPVMDDPIVFPRG